MLAFGGGGASTELRLVITGDGRVAVREMGKVDSSVKRLGRSTADWTRIAQRTSRVMMGIGAAGVAGYGLAIKQAATFESTMKDVELQARASNAEMDAIKETALGPEMVKLGKSGGDVAVMFKRLASEGYGVAQMKKMLIPITQATIFAGQGEAETTKLMLSLMEQYNYEAGEMQAITDELAKALASTSYQGDELSQVMSYVGSAAGRAGMSLRDTAIVTDFAMKKIQDASRVGTGFRMVMASIEKGSDKLREEFAKAGISYEELVASTKDGATFTELMARAVANGTNMMNAFEVRAGTVANMIAEHTAPEVEALRARMDEAAGGAEYAEKKMKTFEGQVEQLQAAAKNLGIEIGTAVLPRFTEWLEKLNQAVQDSDDLAETIQTGLNVAIGIGLAGVLMSGTIMLSNFAKALGLGTGGLGAAAKGATALIGTPAGGLVAGVIALTAALAAIDTPAEEASEELAKLKERTDAITESMGRLVAQIEKEIAGEKIKAQFEIAKKAVQEYRDAEIDLDNVKLDKAREEVKKLAQMAQDEFPEAEDATESWLADLDALDSTAREARAGLDVLAAWKGGGLIAEMRRVGQRARDTLGDLLRLGGERRAAERGGFVPPGQRPIGGPATIGAGLMGLPPAFREQWGLMPADMGPAFEALDEMVKRLQAATDEGDEFRGILDRIAASLDDAETEAEGFTGALSTQLEKFIGLHPQYEKLGDELQQLLIPWERSTQAAQRFNDEQERLLKAAFRTPEAIKVIQETEAEMLARREQEARRRRTAFWAQMTPRERQLAGGMVPDWAAGAMPQDPRAWTGREQMMAQAPLEEWRMLADLVPAPIDWDEFDKDAQKSLGDLESDTERTAKRLGGYISDSLSRGMADAIMEGKMDWHSFADMVKRTVLEVTIRETIVQTGISTIIGGLLGDIWGGIRGLFNFDNPLNDSWARYEGGRFAKFFGEGAEAGMRARDLGVGEGRQEPAVTTYNVTNNIRTVAQDPRRLVRELSREQERRGW